MTWTGQVPALMNCYPSLPVCNVCPECDDVSADILRSSLRAAIAHTYIVKTWLCSPPQTVERRDFSLQLWPQTHHLGGARPLQHYQAHDKNFKRETQGVCQGLWKSPAGAHLSTSPKYRDFRHGPCITFLSHPSRSPCPFGRDQRITTNLALLSGKLFFFFPKSI